MRAWLLAARPKTLGAALAPVAVGTACAAVAGGAELGPALAALAGALLIQIGTNFANDVLDFERGADTAERVGPTRAVQAGLLTPAEMRRGMFVAFALATACGVYLTAVAGWPVIAIGLASIAAGIAYTGGPYPLGYHGLGDVFVMIFFGFVAVLGTTYVQVEHLPAVAWWTAVPVGALSTAILVVNNLRDRHTDARCGKRTLAVRLGRRGALGEYAILLLAAYAVPPGLVIAGLAGSWALLPLATLPLAALELDAVTRREGAALNGSLAGTARLLTLYSLLLAVGLVV
jgi:1,4-dihydroxy-2-naphthoate polyprenyltransferase